MAFEGTVDYNKFNVEYLSFSKLEENSRSKGQMIAYPRYDPTNSGKEGPLLIQSPWIKLYTYGVPRLGEYYKTDDDRLHLRVPFDLSIPEVGVFADKMKSIDTSVGSTECMDLMLGKKSKKYKYQPIYREGQDQTNDDSDDEEKKPKDTPPRPPYMKIKLDTTWPDKNIKTQVFLSVLNKDTGKRTRTKVENINTVDDFANIVRFLSNVRLMFRPIKYWAHNLTKKDPQCGIVFKLVKVEVEPNQQSNTMYKQIYETDNFIDSDDDEPLPKQKQLQNVETIHKIDNQEKKALDNESDDEPDDEPAIGLKQNSDETNESDDESDDEVVVQSTKNIVQVDSDSDESSDDEPVQSKGKGKKPIATKSKK